MDTIVALATAPGRSAIGVIRLSGPRSLAIASSLIEESDFQPHPAQVILKTIKLDSADLDQALFTYFRAPHSYTGEDVLEISCHGSPVILRQVVDQMLLLGARLAGPGEFTLRALSNGKLTLSQAEAVRDLIDARTDAAARQAARQLKGELSARLQRSKQRLLDMIVLLESALEFVEDDLPALERERLHKTLAELLADLSLLAETFQVGHFLRDGLKVAIIGRPNVGKSSVFNRLLSSERAIVTEVAGTTRDTLTEPINLHGVPVMLTDTAGVRESLDRIEKIGVERTQQAMVDADLVLVVIDGSMALTREDHDVLSQVESSPHVVVCNKSDVPSYNILLDPSASNPTIVKVSAVTDQGMDQLRAAILAAFGLWESSEAGLLITDARHYDLLRRSLLEIKGSAQLLNEEASEELIVVGLHNALQSLGEITGETTTEDILSQIFATFCIGK
ncbi:MAG: tRNA uridine-5-carboxymethylaminomethyl(34) synthesis GTPase MnmE [bacterium]